jgi:serine/threonine-protein kinase
MITENSLLNTRYRLDKKIGQGGFAQVFLSTDQLLKRRVAVKVLNSELTEDENFLARFEREAQSIASLEHPNILGVYDYGQAEGTAYLVMPYIEGGTLHDKLRRERKLSLAETSYYLQQAAAALDYAHRRNIVHRDIKPQNMMLRTEDNRLLLGDFGIAKVLGGASSHSGTGVMGTLAYMSPEQLEGHATIVTDVYALGCVLFQMLTGQLPYTGGTEMVVMGHLTRPVPSIVERSNGELPSGLQPIIERALAKRPEDRYQTAGELARAFQAIAAGNVYLSGQVSTPVSGVSPTLAATPSAEQTPFARPVTGQPSVNSDNSQLPTVAQPYTPSGAYTRPATPATGSSIPTVMPTQPPTAGPNTVLASRASTKGINPLLLAGIGGLVLVVIVAAALILVLGGSKTGTNPTATIAAVPATTAPASANPATSAPATNATGATNAATTAAPAGTTSATGDPVASALKEASDTFFVKGDLSSGITRYRNLTQSYPTNAKVWRDYGHALHLGNRDAGGIEPLQKAAQLDAKDPLTFLYLADTLLDNYRYKEAEQAAKTAAQLDQTSWIGHAALASYYNRVYDKNTARSELEAMQKAVGNSSSDPYYNWLLSNVQFTLEDYKNALDALDRTLASWPRLPSAIALKGIYLIYSAGDFNNPTEGLKLLGDALKLQPQSSTTLTELAYYYTFIAGDHQKGKEFATQALKIYSSEPKAVNALGYITGQEKDYNGAYKQFETCVNLDSLHFQCYTNWALTLMDQAAELNASGKRSEAQTAYKSAIEKAQKALAIVPADPDINWVVGITYYRTGDYKNSIDAFQKAINIAPNIASYYGWLGSALFEDGQKDRARLEYNKGVAIDPEDAQVKELGKKLK